MPKKTKVQKDIPIVAEEETIYQARINGKLQESPVRPRLIDLFVGAGGMTLGFTRFTGHPFEPVWSNDFNEYAVKTYNSNFGNHCHVGDIVDILQNSTTNIPEADVVIGGPPCQGFSLLNKFRDGDPRKQLWRPFMEIVELSGASIFVMENVPQLLGSFEHGEIVELAHTLGFKVRSAKLCAADYGVPQVRWRAFIIGCKFTDPSLVFPPKKTNLLLFFQENTGNAISGEELRYIAKNKTEWARRVRELRTEEGWPVLTKTTGMPELPVGIYVFASNRQSPKDDRAIKDDLRRAVFVRDNYTCLDCGWTAHQWNRSDPRNLEAHHEIPHSKGGKTVKENLNTLCNVCHDVRHRKK